MPIFNFVQVGQSKCSGAGYISADLFETNSHESTCRPGAGHAFGTRGYCLKALRVNGRTRLAFAPGDARYVTP